MNEYQVAIIVLAILGGVWGIISGTNKIVSPLTETMAKLNITVETLTKELEDFKNNNSKSHEKLWSHEEKQDLKIEDHEKRLIKIERGE